MKKFSIVSLILGTLLMLAGSSYAEQSFRNGPFRFYDKSTFKHDVEIIGSTTKSVVFEGATDNTYETRVGVVEPTADLIYLFPTGTAGTYYPLVTSLATNQVGIANSVTGASNSLIWEGTADAYEITLDAADATADVSYRLADTTAGTYTVANNEAKPTESVTATNVITASECGKTFFLNSATEFASTLPAISTITAGCTFSFIVKAAPSGASYTILTGNSLENVLIGGINELEVDTGDDGPYQAAGDTITLVDGIAAVGDFVSMISDGTSWYLHGQTNLDGGATIAQAD